MRSVKDKFLVDTTTTDSTGKFSLYLPLGTFKIKVQYQDIIFHAVAMLCVFLL